MTWRLGRKAGVLAFAVLAIGWAVVTYYLLTTPHPPGSEADASWLPTWVFPTLGHFGLFAGLSVLLFVPVLTATLLTRHAYVTALIVVLVAAAYGGGLELYQAHLPERSASWTDGVVNFVGAVLGVLAVLLTTKMLGSRDRHDENTDITSGYPQSSPAQRGS